MSRRRGNCGSLRATWRTWLALGLVSLALACGDDSSDGEADAGVSDGGEVAPDGSPPDDGGLLDAFLDAALDGGEDGDGGLPYCGDGTVDDGEECDEGEDNSDTAANACRTDCTRSRCGDGVEDSGEECDTGPMRSDVLPDLCRTDCTLPRCGDAIVDSGEACDTGLMNSDHRPNACRTTCQLPTCGDGAVDTGEECDTGADRSDTEPLACRLDCTNSTCGDGALDEGEQCDDGTENANRNDTCRTNCTLPRCGDGIVDHREQCDGGPNCNPRFCRWNNVGDPPVPVAYDADDMPYDACTTATPALCDEFLRESWSEFNPMIRGRYRIGPSYPCWEYFSIACAPCPYWDLASCEDVLDAPAVCSNPGVLVCRTVLYEDCPSDFDLTMCGSPTFRYQRAPLYTPACRTPVEGRCESLARDMCPSDIDACAAYETSGTAPAGCSWYLSGRCPSVISTSCPSVTTETCSDTATALAGRHPVCTDYLMTRCAGWEDRLCPDTTPQTITPELCTESYGVLTSRFPVECHDWLELQCRGEVAAQAQTTYTSAGGCPSETTRVDSGGDFVNRTDSVSDPARHDCPIYAYEPAPAALVSFDATPLEYTLADADTTLYERDLGTVAVGSCQEYVEQRFHTYNVFRAYTERFYDDARRVHQLAYSGDDAHLDVAIGHRALTIGQPFTHYGGGVLPGDFALGMDGGWTPKNDFYRLMWTQNAEIRDVLLNISDHLTTFENALDPMAEARNQTILDKLAGQELTYLTRTVRGPDDGWHHHLDMSDAYGARGVSDEVLSFNWGLRDQFNQLMDERRVLVAQRDEVRVVIGGMDPIGDRIRADILAIDKDIHELLKKANERGCFNLTRDASGEVIPHACDWAPQDFVEDVQAMFEVGMERELERCEQLAPADFSSLSMGYTYLSGTTFRTETADPTLGSIAFQTYLNRQEYTYANLDDGFDTENPERAPTYGESYGVGDTIGIPEWFGAGYDAGASWFLDFPPHPTTGDPDLCQIDAGAEVHMQAWVDLATIRFHAIDGGIDVAMRDATGAADPRFSTHLSVLGVDIWDEDLSGAGAIDAVDREYDYNVVFEQDVADEGFDASVEAPVFSLAGFDVVVRIGAAGRVGLDIGGGLAMALDTSGDCGPGGHIDLEATARPFGVLSGFAELGIDLFIVELGVGASLEVIELALPVTTSLGFQTDGPLRDTNLRVAAHADLELELLSGRVYAYADTWWKTYKTTLFRWNGPSWEVPIFHKDWAYPLGPLVTFCDINPSACE